LINDRQRPSTETFRKLLVLAKFDPLGLHVRWQPPLGCSLEKELRRPDVTGLLRRRIPGERRSRLGHPAAPSVFVPAQDLGTEAALTGNGVLLLRGYEGGGNALSESSLVYDGE